MKNSIVGITSDIKGKFYEVESFYFESLLKVGAIPVMLPMITNKNDIRKISKKINSLLVSGSRDIDPKFYGQVKKYKINSLDIKRTISEINYIEEFTKQKKKILGICGGMQLINVYFGGSLIQDIKSQLKSKINHSKAKYHKIKILKNTLVKKITRSSDLRVNTFHHQCIDKLGSGLIASSSTSDGIIESFESLNRKILGVQWHPELMKDRKNQMIFNWLKS